MRPSTRPRTQNRPITISRAFLALVTVIATVAAVVATPLTTVTAGASTSDWRVGATYPSSADPTNVTCPSTLHCYAVGTDRIGLGQIMATTDGGNSWTDQAVPSGVTYLEGIACSSTSDCVAVGSHNPGVILATTNAGTTWSIADSVTSASSMWGATCLPSLVCFAVGDGATGGIVLKSTDGGTTWTAQVLPSGITSLHAVACFSDSDCTAVGTALGGFAGIVETTDGGTTWSTEPVPSGVGTSYSVSCPSLTECFAVGGDDILATTDGGTSWTLAYTAAPSSSGLLWSISCPSTSDCVAVGHVDYQGLTLSTADGGSTWTSLLGPYQVQGLNGVSCSSTSECTSVGNGVILATSDAGTTWVRQPGPAGVNRLNDIACPSSSECVAVGGPDDSLDVGGGGTVLASTDGGTVWQGESLPPGVGTLFGIACPSISVCYAVGDNEDDTSFILATTDGGATWTSEVVPAGVIALNSIACPSTSACMAAGDDLSDGGGYYSDGVILSTTDGGNSWSSTAETGVENLDSVACITLTECFVGGASSTRSAIFSTTDGGSTWTSQTFPGGALSGIACFSADDCTAVGGGSILATSNAGQSWIGEPAPAGVEGLSDVACPSASVCEAVGSNSTNGVIVATTDAGATWTSATVPSGVNLLSGVSCLSRMDCVAVGQGSAERDDGGLILLGSDLDPVTITTSTLPPGAIGHPYSTTLTAVGGTTPYNWSITSGALPAGLSLDEATGVISGTPTSGRSSSFTVEVTDSSSPSFTSKAALAIRTSAPVITTKALPSGVTGRTYSGKLTATGGIAPYAWTVTQGALPVGLVFSAATGTITGSPKYAGTSAFQVTVRDSSAPTLTASTELSITDTAGPLKITTTSLKAGKVGQAYSARLGAAGGKPLYKWKLGTGSKLPTGLVLFASDGVINGAPTVKGTFTFKVYVTDANLVVIGKTLSITIS